MKYFQRFKAGWPIRDFIKQYLANNHDKFKRALREERKAEAADPDVWADSSDDEEGSGSDEDAVELGVESDEGDDVAAQDNDADKLEPTEDIDIDIDLILDGTKPLAEEPELFPSTPVKSGKEKKKQKVRFCFYPAAGHINSRCLGECGASQITDCLVPTSYQVCTDSFSFPTLNLDHIRHARFLKVPCHRLLR